MRKHELLTKSREAMMSAVQIYNNPQVYFKAESFITLSIISWTYLLHMYYKSKKIDYRYFSMKGKLKRYDKTKYGAYKHWELERCLNDKNCPLDKESKENLKFLIGIRHEIEHQMTRKIDNAISAKIIACSINYNYYIKEMFGEKFGIDSELGIAIQFSEINEEQKDQLLNSDKLPRNMEKFVMKFESDLNKDIMTNERYAYRVVFTKLNVNRVNQADKVIEFLSPDSPLAKGVNQEYRLIKETEKIKYLPSQIVNKINQEGYIKFNIANHTKLWKSIDSGEGRKKLKNKGFGIYVAEKNWMWYESWYKHVLKYCKENETEFK